MIPTSEVTSKLLLCQNPRTTKSGSQPPWKPEDIVAFLKAIEPYADKYLQFQRDRAESEHRFARLGATHDWRIAAVAFTFLGVLVALMSWLSDLGKVSGDALLFLAGTITGYIFSMIVKFRWYSPVEEEEEN